MEELSIALSIINGLLNRKEKNACCCKIHNSVGLQYLAEYVGDVHSDGIISEDSVVRDTLSQYFGDFFIIPKVGGGSHCRVVLEL